MSNKLAESQKDFRIKKLEEQLITVKKNNKLNKSLLKKKDEQIKNLIDRKNVSRDINNCLYFRLYGWDCDSILLFNSDCIVLDNIKQVGA